MLSDLAVPTGQRETHQTRPTRNNNGSSVASVADSDKLKLRERSPTSHGPDPRSQIYMIYHTLLGVSRISPVSREAFNGRATPNFQLQHPLCPKSRLKQPLPELHIEPCTLRGCSYHHNASTSAACRNMRVLPVGENQISRVDTPPKVHENIQK